MNVIVADIALDRELAAAMGCKALPDFRQGLSEIDILSVHVPLNETTRHLISKSELQQMKSGAILINCARGGIVDETALLAALEDGKLAGAGLDVYSTELPPKDDPFYPAY